MLEESSKNMEEITMNVEEIHVKVVENLKISEGNHISKESLKKIERSQKQVGRNPKMDEDGLKEMEGNPK